jgi:hypothetical protein
MPGGWDTRSIRGHGEHPRLAHRTRNGQTPLQSIAGSILFAAACSECFRFGHRHKGHLTHQRPASKEQDRGARRAPPLVAAREARMRMVDAESNLRGILWDRGAFVRFSPEVGSGWGSGHDCSGLYVHGVVRRQFGECPGTSTKIPCPPTANRVSLLFAGLSRFPGE